MTKKAMQNIIDIENLQLHLKSEAGDLQILKNINQKMQQGQTICIVGPSGSGKTSLMMLLGGLEKPTSGTITIQNTEITELDENQLAKFRQEHIGIVFQNFHLIPTMTAVENIAIPLEFAGEKDAFKKAEEALEQVGLKERAKHYPSQLSGGEQQRVAIARAFVSMPKILLADEPTGNLDVETGQKIIDLMFNLCEKSGTTLVLITHDPELAAKCDQRLHLIDGEIQHVD